ncbi:MAG: serine/threonine protein kinase, partial [Leptospiraceae bacterium]|nr:serine/threonine protein kinase [Leptospiraceae bacterium]
MPDTIEKIQDFEIINLISETHKSLVYKAKHKKFTNPIILKTFKKKYPSSWELARIKQENRVIQALEHPGIVKSLGLVWQDNSISIVLEDTGGESLKECITKNKISISNFLNLGIRLSDALFYIHSRGIVHKDIKPQNIIVRYSGNEFNDVKITDFGLSTIQDEEIQSIYNPKVIEGTLPYISPEQTGRMNINLDFRSDFYSLGITFYEILTGELPFLYQDPIELIHSHIARTPPEIFNKKNEPIPEEIKEIVKKLLSKSPEDRYQNAIGLKRELEYCLEQYKRKGTISG